MPATVSPTFYPTYFGACPPHLKRDDARIIRVDNYGATKAFDVEVTTPGWKRVTVSMHLVTRGGAGKWAVVTMGGTRVWRYLAADGWVEAIADTDPRASVFFAMQRAEQTFDCPWEAIHAAATALSTNAPTHAFRGAVEIKDEWGTLIPYGEK
jgi:hypothetical protein